MKWNYYAISSSYAATASYALNASSTNTGSLLLNASALQNVITFTRGNGSVFNVTVATGSSISSAFPYTGSAQITGSLGITGSFSQQGSANIFLKGLINQVNPTSHVVMLDNTTGQLYITASSALGGGGGGGGTPGGLTGQIQYNNAGAFGGVPSLTFDGTTLRATGSFTGSFTGSLFGTSSWAITASYALNGGVTQLLAGSNITLSPTNGLGQVTVSATGGSGTYYNTSTGSYGSFYDTTTQTATSINTPYSMSFNTTDITNGVAISGSGNNKIKVTNAGVYNIQFSAQLARAVGSGTEDVLIWIRKNGSDLSYTNTDVTFAGGTNVKTVAAWNWFVTAAANDYYEIMWSTTSTNIVLEANLTSTPAVPSVILTVNRIDTFLSNTGSFSGSFTGLLIGTASYASTASYVLNAVSASYANTASYVQTAQTASYYKVFPYTGSAIISGSLIITGSTSITSGSLSVNKSGSTVVDIQGSQGQLFSIVDSLSGSLMSVNDVSGLPILEVFSDDRVVIGTYGAPGLIVSASRVSATGSFSGSFTGSLFGTSSWANNAITASFARTASYVNPLVQSVFISGSTQITGSTIIKGDFSVNSAATVDFNTNVLNINAPLITVPTFATPYSPSVNIRTVMYDAVSNALFVTSSLPGTGGGGTGLSNFISTGSITASVNTDINNLFLVKSGSVDLLKINSEKVLITFTQSATPTPIIGGIFISSSGDLFFGI
jgi:hypothetical protein